MGCCKSTCQKLEPCCNAIGCSCSEKEGEGAKGVVKERNCTDIPWLIAYFVGLIGLFVIWGESFAAGDIDMLMSAVDYTGEVCGKGDRADLPAGVWVDTDSFEFKICAKECTATWDNYYLNSEKIAAEAVAAGETPPPIVSDMVAPYESEFNRGYCVPVGGTSIAGYDDHAQQARRQIEDMYETMPVIIVSAAIALLFGFLFVYLMRNMLGCIIWGGVLLIFLGGLLTAYFLFTSAADIKDPDTKLMQQIIGGIIGALTVLFLIVIICLRDRIKIAIEVIKSAGRALTDVPMLVLTPFGPQFLAIAFIIVWMIATAHMFSLAESYDEDTPYSLTQLFADTGYKNSYGEEYPATFKRLDYNSAITNTFWFHFFMLLWTLQICTYWLYLVVAGVVSDWYFSKRDGEEGPKIRGEADDELSHRPIYGAFCRSLKHFGTLVFAAFIIATIQFIRWVLRYIERQMHKSNACVKYFICILDCCLGCIESCMDCISKRALIITSISGKPLCSAFSITFNIIWVNMVRVSVMMLFTGIVIFVGKVCVCLATTGVSVLIIYYAYDDLSGIMMPTIMIFLLSYVIASAFMTVYETAVDTVFLCFLLDEEWNAKNPDANMFADKALLEIVAKYSDMSKEVAETEGGVRNKDGQDYSAAGPPPDKDNENVGPKV